MIQHAVRSLRSESEGELVGIEYGLLRIGLLVRVPYCEVREKESKLGGSTRDEEYEHFFREARPRLVGQAYLLCGSLQEAQDLAQEVLLRAWQNWSRVRDLDDAQAWARHVLHNLAISNWRRQRLRLRRHGLALPSSSPDPGVGHLDVASAVGVVLPPHVVTSGSHAALTDRGDVSGVCRGHSVYLWVAIWVAIWQSSQ